MKDFMRYEGLAVMTKTVIFRPFGRSSGFTLSFTWRLFFNKR